MEIIPGLQLHLDLMEEFGWVFGKPRINRLRGDYSFISADNQVKNPSHQSPSGIWRPPPLGYLKCNTDAAYVHSRAMGAASMVFRDREGFLEFSSAKKVATSSALIAEGLALREAMNIAINLGMQRVIFESDCLQLVSACREEGDSGKLMPILTDIFNLKNQFQACGFTLVHRDGNVAAHSVATLALRDRLPLNWQGALPLELKEALAKDRTTWRRIAVQASSSSPVRVAAEVFQPL
ncbi:Ribonuclease H-like superfamily [Sesbania bispinosa]|nr:Ribonuclease H-like superfamily [Sesbania bispinosa]